MLSQAIEQLSSSEDEEQPSDSVTGVFFFTVVFLSFLELFNAPFSKQVQCNYQKHQFVL